MLRGFFNSAIAMTGILLYAGSSFAAVTPPVPNFNQGFDRLAPKSLPREDAPQADAPGGEIPEASGDEALITDKLAGLIFVAKPADVIPDGIKEPQEVLGGEKIKISGFAPPDEEAFRAVARSRIGLPASMLSLNQLLRELVLHYRRNNRPVVDIYIPEQAMLNSVVQVVVTEGRIGEIRAEGNRYFKSELLTTSVRAEPGGVIYSDRMARDVAWLNNNPFRQVDLVYVDGQEEGTTDVVLKTTDRFPLRGYASFDDSGNKLSQDERISIGANYGNLFGLDQQFNYQYIGSPDFNSLRAHSASYVVPLPWRHTLTVFGSYGDTQATIPLGPGAGNLLSTGFSWQTSMRYNIPLMDIPLSDKTSYKQELVLGYDYKESNSNLFTNDLPTVGTSPNEVSQFSLGYNGSIPDAWGSTTFTSTAFFSPGQMTSENNTDSFNSGGTNGNNTRCSYVYGRVTLNRITKLPDDFTFATNALYQLSNSRLIGSEQLGLGGYATVRGYDEREANGDEGFLLSNELRTPTFSLGKPMGLEKAEDQMQLLFFCDYGQTHIHAWDNVTVTTPSTYTLASIGPGFRYNISQYVTARFDYGWQLENPGLPVNDPSTIHNYDSRGHFSITVSY